MNIREVADKAGVSVATISRVLNHPELVLPDTREHVLAVMKECSYTPNWFARGLNLGKTNTIALLIPGIETGLYQKIISGVETVARNKGYAILFCNTYGDAQVENDYLTMMSRRRVDGIVLVSSRLDEVRTAFPEEVEIPCVHVGKKRIGGCETICYIDFVEGACRLFSHLISLGHTRIDLLTNDFLQGELAQIELGIQRAQQTTGKRLRIRQYAADNTVQGGYVAAQKMIQQGDMPSALVTASAEQTFGVLKAAMDGGLAIPEQMALASMTDSPVCSIVSPPITALEHPGTRLGMAAARLLMDSIENSQLELNVPQEMILQPKLKIRRSCGNTKYIYELFD